MPMIPRIMTFSAYGLNKHRNCLHPINMKCICCEDFDDLTEIVSDLLIDNDCDNCAVFMHSLDDTLYAAVKEWDLDTNKCVITMYNSLYRGEYEFFSIIDSNFKLCCYSLLIETNNNEWRIIDA